MLELVPTELWSYGIRDLGRGIVTALGRRESPAVLSIPGLGNCIPARSARSALVTAIKALELPPGATHRRSSLLLCGCVQSNRSSWL